MANTSSEPQVGIVVDDIVISGHHRGSYLVYVPKLHGNISNKTDYVGLGSNLGGLDLNELEAARKLARPFYPTFPVESGGAMPFDPNSGVVSTDTNATDVSPDNVSRVQGSKITKPAGTRGSAGNGIEYHVAQTEGPMALTQINHLDTRTGYTTNIREGSAVGNFAHLSIGTRVLVQGNFIINMLPHNQNDWLNQFLRLNNEN